MRLCVVWAFVIGVFLTGQVAAGAAAYYNIAAIESEQLSNAVRVTIKSDGVVSFTYDMRQYIDYEMIAKQDGHWTPDALKPVERISFQLLNARSQVGSFVHVGKYPVSHVELSIPPTSNGTFRLDVQVCLYVPLTVRSVNTGSSELDEGQSAYSETGFDMARSMDRRSIIITVPTDRRPDILERRKADDVPEEDRQLQVSFADGLVDVHARNVALADVVEAVGRAAGRKMVVIGAAERLVTAELPHIAADEFAARMAECYGLILKAGTDCLEFAEIPVGTSGAHLAGLLVEMPVRHLKAEVARSLLPSFLLDYVRVDRQRNVLMVCGSDPLVAKVRADLARIDRPAVTVAVQTRLIECSSTRNLVRDLALDYSAGTFDLLTDSSSGRISYSRIGNLPTDFSAKLTALVAAQKARVRADSTVTVLAGETAEVFSGLARYIQVEVIKEYGKTEEAVPVSAGVKLRVTPRTGGREIMISIASEVKDIAEIDPLTGLPVVNTRSAEGTFRVADGETVMIGGLSERQTRETVRRIPILSQLPIIGGFFRSRSKQQSVSELVLLLTPRIVSAAG